MKNIYINGREDTNNLNYKYEHKGGKLDQTTKMALGPIANTTMGVGW